MLDFSQQHQQDITEQERHLAKPPNATQAASTLPRDNMNLYASRMLESNP